MRLAYRDFPLTQVHSQAQVAAEASRCAGEQGRYWEYHDRLFAKEAQLDAASLAEYARSLAQGDLVVSERPAVAENVKFQ